MKKSRSPRQPLPVGADSSAINYLNLFAIEIAPVAVRIPFTAVD
jgi:hypothetical protein